MGTDTDFDFSSENLSDDELEVSDVLGLPDEGRSGFRGNEGYEEVERYWVNRPYTYISILYNERDQNYFYFVVEPELDQYEQFLHREVSGRLRDRLKSHDIEEDDDKVLSAMERREHVLLDESIDVIRQHGVGHGTDTMHKVLYFIERDFIRYGKIEPIMQDNRIEDISCDGVSVPIYVFHKQLEDVETNIEFKRQELNKFVIRLAQRSGKHISAADPLVDASLPNGSRAQLTLGKDISTRGSTFTIRLFRDEPLTPVHLIDFGTFSLEQMSYLWLAIENDMSLIFAGGTGSGKTTSMNAVSLFIPPKQKVVSIEDTREIKLPHQNWIPMVTKGSFGAGEGEGEEGSVNMFKLLYAALRQRPEYLLVGEVRGDESRTLFQAMSTGHTTYSTFHAEDVDSVFKRFRNEPINVSEQMLTALDIVSIQEEYRINGDRERRNNAIAEVIGVSGDGVEYKNRFTYSPEIDEHTETPGVSQVLTNITQQNGWSESDRANEERDKREEVLEYMVENDIKEYKDVTRVIQAFMIDQDRVLEKVRTDELDPSDFESMESVM
jgi:flagellar protein FlaI